MQDALYSGGLVRGQRSEIRDQRSEIGGQKTDPLTSDF
jgi:hypothetical protein